MRSRQHIKGNLQINQCFNACDSSRTVSAWQVCVEPVSETASVVVTECANAAWRIPELRSLLIVRQREYTHAVRFVVRFGSRFGSRYPLRQQELLMRGDDFPVGNVYTRSLLSLHWLMNFPVVGDRST